MKILIAADHGGFPLKEYLQQAPQLKGHNIEWVDLGTHETDSVDYPDFAASLCKGILVGQTEKGILVCGSGQGMAMKANRHKGIRAALCWDLTSASLSREHNNSNVLCLGSRLLPFDLAVSIVEKWITTPYAGGRHEKRVQKLDQ